MNIKRHVTALVASLLMTAAWGQAADKPLNLKLPAGEMPAPSASAASAPASASSSATVTGSVPALPPPADASPASQPPAHAAPGVYYGDTSGSMGDTGRGRRPACDDSTYNQPQVHGSVGMGVMAGSHMSGNYQTGSVSVSKRLGSCDDPKGGMSMSISVGGGHFDGRPRGRW